MLNNLIHSASDYHRMYLQNAQRHAHHDALKREAKTRRLRAALGQRLIAAGERLAKSPLADDGLLDRAA